MSFTTKEIIGNSKYFCSLIETKNIEPNNSSNKSNIEGVSSIPVNFNNEDANVSFEQINNLLGNISKSIRYFNVVSLKFEMPKGGENVKFSASAEAYYANEILSSETNETITAKGGKK